MRYDDAFQNSKHIPGGAEYAGRWAQASAAFRAACSDQAELGLRYGDGPAGWFDLYRPAAETAGLLVFIHGGYWHLFSPRDFSHLAAGALARGWAVAMPAYPLAPSARIAAMTGAVAASVAAAADRIPGPVVLTGHSAGGHLAARMAAAGSPLPAGVAGRLARVVPVSPLTDLRPIMETSMNATLHIDRAEAAAESPVLLAPRPGLAVRLWVGAAERPVFLDQARRLGNAWACPVTVDPGRHHFDVIEGFEDPASPLMDTLLGPDSR